jgi:hypothetical protein
MFFPKRRGVEANIERLSGAVSERRIPGEPSLESEPRELVEERLQPLHCDPDSPPPR